MVVSGSLLSRRRGAALAAAVVVATALLVPAGTSIAAADPSGSEVRTFDQEPLGLPPAATTVGGTVVVDSAPFGAAGNRAVHLTDTSATAQSIVTFAEPATAVRHFSIDLSLHQLKQPVFVAVQGQGASAALGMWRFMIAPAYGRNSDAQISVYSGSAWVRLAVLPDLTVRDRPTRLEIEAGTTAAVLRSGDFVFRTSTRASAGTAVTGLQLASSGSAPTGSDVYLDNYSAGAAADDSALAPGTAAVGILPSLTASTTPTHGVVGTVMADGATAADLAATVYVGGQWQRASVVPEPRVRNTFRISARLLEPNIGLHPVTISVTDRRSGLTRSTQLRIQSYAPIPTRVVAQETGPRQPRFPDVIRLQDGSLLVAWHFATAHTKANGVIRVARSTDNGASWSAPWTVVENDWDNRDPKLTQLRDGTILLSTFRTDWSTNPAGDGLGTFVFRSSDNGATFPDVTKVDSAQPGAWEHAPAVELANGDILQPLYGYGARVARSTDGGTTFPASQEITVVADEAAYANVEPNVVLLPSGELVMLIRTADNVWGQETSSRLTRSFDGGHSWTPLETTDLPTSSHHMLVTADGSVLVTFGNQWQDGRPTYAALITDPSGPWTGYRQVPVFNSGWDDQANPSSVQLPDGSLLSFGFNVIDRTVLSWATTEQTYR